MANLPTCRNPNHPIGVRRDDMVITDENEYGVMFACRPCKEILKIESAQYKTLPKGWRRAAYLNELRQVERRKEWMTRRGRLEIRGGRE